MNWGKGIIIAFVLFTAFIATLVTVCMRENVSLVSKDYYNEELKYQQQIHRMNNANQLVQKPSIQKTGNFLAVDFNQLNQIESGELKLFNPSDPEKDRKFNLTASDKTQLFIPLNNIEHGMYRAQMVWTMQGKEYFIETIITI